MQLQPNIRLSTAVLDIISDCCVYLLAYQLDLSSEMPGKTGFDAMQLLPRAVMLLPSRLVSSELKQKLQDLKERILALQVHL